MIPLKKPTVYTEETWPLESVFAALLNKPAFAPLL
jgi:hypothetical protein